MPAGSVLLADDEETFRESTCRLLRRHDFDCHGVKDTEEAIDLLRRDRFDVLVSDIRMPRNPDLRIVREARQLDSQIPVILVTGYPSTETAVRGIGMAVDAYLTKPIDFEELLGLVRKGAERSRNRRRLSSVIARLRSVAADLETGKPRPLVQGPDFEDPAVTTIRTLASCLSDLLILRGKTEADHGLSNLCDLLDCPQRAAHRQAILNAIEVLERTKDNFKSKALAELRLRLENSVGIG